MSLETESIVKYLFWDSYILAQSSPADSQFLQVIQIDGDAPPDRPAAFLKISKHFFFLFFFFCHTDQFLLDHGSNVLGEKCSTRKKNRDSVGRSLERRTWNYGRTYLMGPIKNSEVPRTLVSLSPPASERSSCWSPVATIKRLLFKGLCFY